MNKKKISILLFTLIAFLKASISCFSLLSEAQASIIERIQAVKPSIVEVHTKTSALFRTPESAAIDKSTGVLVGIKGIAKASVSSSGSGVIIDPAGIIATNAHVISNASKIAVVLHDQTIAGATVLKTINDQDLAFLKITPPYPLKEIEFADSRQIRIGDEVITVGSSPFLKNTISAGRITSIGRSSNKQSDEFTQIFQVNINIYHGDSGGPLFDKQGRLAGLMVARLLHSDRLSYAISSSTILQQYLYFLKELNETMLTSP